MSTKDPLCMLKKIISIFVAIILVASSANAQIKCDKNILFTKNALKVEPAIIEIYEDNYVPDENIKDKVCSLEHVQDKKTEQDLLENIENLLSEFKILNSKNRQKLNESTQLLILSFLSMFYLAKNGYKNPLMKELSFFTERLLEINSLLENEDNLTQDEKVHFLKTTFNFMSNINKENFKYLSLEEKQRVVQFLNEFSREVLKENYAVEYNKLISKDMEKQGLAIFAFIMLFSIAIFVQGIGVLRAFEFSNQMIFDNGPLVGISALSTLLFSSIFAGYQSSSLMYKKWISKIRKDSTRIHEAAKSSCLIYLDEGH